MSEPGGAPVRAILFDAAGTLFVLREPVGDTYARFARQHGVELPAWRIGDAFGRILARMPERHLPGRPAAQVAAHERDWWRQVLRGTFLATDQTIRFADFEAFFDDVYHHYATADAWQLRPGALSLLDDLEARGLRLGIVSNFDERLLMLLQDLGIKRFFGTIAIPSTTGEAKPDEAAFRAALAALGVDARHTLYVGDDAPGDLEAARAAGLRSFDASRCEGLDELPARWESVATLPPRLAR